MRTHPVGLSPRGRGKHNPQYVGLSMFRSIPAWAGETAYSRLRLPRRRVYPRVGGGNRRIADRYLARRGLSPCGRGKLSWGCSRGSFLGSIPAWAGETAAVGCPGPRGAVYPRVGGGNWRWYQGDYSGIGLSPRGRGKRDSHYLHPSIWRSIPAWAGETASENRQYASRKVYPRVGGGNGSGAVFGFSSDGLSPRGRGKPADDANHSIYFGSIPAWAGETLSTVPLHNDDEVYPRVGGGNRLAGSRIE